MSFTREGRKYNSKNFVTGLQYMVKMIDISMVIVLMSEGKRKRVTFLLKTYKLALISLILTF